MKSIADEILKSHEKFHINLGLERIKAILELLGNPQKNYKIIHVAGTNGKGSTSKIINQIFVQAGIKIGLFTSPHVFSYTERLKVDNENVSPYVFNRLVGDINNLAKTNEIELSEFELLTAVAFYYFYVKGVKYAIFETGLGGLLDATNVVEDSISVITDIDLDHTERLGDTIEKIAEQKAGIIKENSTVIVEKSNAGYSVIERITKEKNAKIVLSEPTELECSLKGEHQKHNAGLAVTLARELMVREDIITSALKYTKWRFRLEYFENKNVLIDAGHNPKGIQTLRKYLDDNFAESKKVFYFGCLKHKDYKNMLQTLIKEGDELKIVEFDYPNSLKLEDLDETYSATKAGDIAEELNSEDNKLKVFCGSIYMLGMAFSEAKKVLGIYEEI